MSSERFRALVFALFLGVLIVFGMIYRPADALSEPVSTRRTNPAQ